MNPEGKFELLKLLSYYRYNMVGHSDLIDPFDYLDESFYSTLDDSSYV